MCCSSRKTGIKAYIYTDSTSPWNKKFLLGVWISELVLTVFVSALGGAFLPSKQKDHRYDDGISEALYVILLFFVVSLTALNIGFLILQTIWYRQNKLHPGWMVFITSFNALVWLSVMALSLYSVVTWSDTHWQVYEAIELLYFVAGLPFIVHLAYSSVVYRRLRKNRRRSADVELTVSNPEEPRL